GAATSAQQQAQKAVTDSAQQAVSGAATSAQQQAQKVVTDSARQAVSGATKTQQPLKTVEDGADTLSDQARADAEAELEKLLN
ncbi:hypothetical protein ACF8QD_13430, partial [Aeromonas media]